MIVSRAPRRVNSEYSAVKICVGKDMSTSRLRYPFENAPPCAKLNAAPLIVMRRQPNPRAHIWDMEMVSSPAAS